jgi:hypothetical protein
VTAVALFAWSAAARAADHDDTPALKNAPRHEARITDLHVFTRDHIAPGKHKTPRRSLIIALSTNPTIPTTAASYLFPSDLALEILIDRHSAVDRSDPEATATFGGTILDPANIAPDIAFSITFDAAGVPQLATSGLDDDAEIWLFAGLRDDPFIRGPRQGRNVAAVVIELPMQKVANRARHRNFLVWATSTVPGATEPIGDLGARALRSQFAENVVLNDYINPAEHFSVLGLRPDVVIFDTTRAAAFPNGRELGDDVVDLVGDPRILSTDCPAPADPMLCNPTANDLPFLANFPYLAPPHGAASGNPGVTLHFGGDDDR